jgi:uncharacterized membrane protein (Fun14 family)
VAAPVRVTVLSQAEAGLVVGLVAGFAVGQSGSVAAFAVAAGAAVTVRLQAMAVIAAELVAGVGSVAE